MSCLGDWGVPAAAKSSSAVRMSRRQGQLPVGSVYEVGIESFSEILGQVFTSHELITLASRDRHPANGEDLNDKAMEDGMNIRIALRKRTEDAHIDNCQLPGHTDTTDTHAAASRCAAPPTAPASRPVPTSDAALTSIFVSVTPARRNPTRHD